MQDGFKEVPRTVETTSEITPDVQQLMDLLESKHKMQWFSLQYADKQVEKEYQHYYHKDIIRISTLYIAFTLILQTIFCTSQVVNYSLTRPNEYFIKILLINAIHITLSLTHYIISRWTIAASLQFSTFQTVLVLIYPAELLIIGKLEEVFKDEFVFLPTLVILLALVSYSQSHMLFTYLLAWAINVIGSYFWIDTRLIYIRYNAYITAMFIIIFICGRWASLRDRRKFQQERSQKAVLQMFHNLLKVFHDGIIITQSDRITFSNQQIDKIFDLSQEEESQFEEKECTRKKINREEYLIENLKTTSPKTQLSYLDTMDNQAFEYSSLWDYFQFQQRMYDPAILQGEEFVNPTDGMYFKFKKYDSEERELSKKLQVFSQMVTLGNNQMLMVTIRDMSQWLELEKQKHITQTKTIAFASAAHEFRNPLNGIIQSLDLLKDKVDMTKGKNYYTVAKNCTQLMLYLVNDILDYAQFEAKQIVLNPEQFILAEIVEECINVMIFQANAKKIELFSEVCDEERNILNTDKNRLRQIIVNLLSNAIKYTTKGIVKVYTSIEEDSLLINIEDTGVGISEEDQQTLFAPFTKIKNNRQLNKQGCGLGLTISKSLAAALGADITMVSKLGVGTTFSIVFERRNQSQLKLSEKVILPDHDNPSQQEENFGTIKKKLSELLTYSRINDQSPKKNSNTKTSQFVRIDTQSFSALDDTFSRLEDNIGQFQSGNVRKKFMSQFELDSLRRPNMQLALEERHESYQSSRQMLSSKPKTIFENKHVKDLKKEFNLTNQQLFEESRCKCNSILIVDDEPFNIMPLEGMLEAHGLGCDTAFNGSAALELVLQNAQSSCRCHQTYKLILTDKQMPFLTGIELAREIRNFENGRDQYRLALLSGEGIDQMKHLLKCQNNSEGIFDFVCEKPLNENDLISMLKESKISFSPRD